MSLRLPRICVVIPTWNNKRDVLDALRSLLESNKEGFQMSVVVVDNGSSDGTLEAVRSEFSTVKLIKNSENTGFVKACNMGLQWAIDKNYDYAALLNDDTIVDRDLIKNVLAEYQNRSRVGAISPKIFFAKGYEFHKKYGKSDLGNVIWYAGGKIDWKNVYGSNRGVDEVDKGQFDKTVETNFATGCFVMFKTEALKEVGLFDDRYFAYMEDVDHSQRLINAGWKVLFSPKGHLWHKVSQSSAIGGEMNDYFLTRNRMLFGLKYASLRTKFALIRESIKLLFNGRKWQKIGIKDYYSNKEY